MDHAKYNYTRLRHMVVMDIYAQFIASIHYNDVIMGAKASKITRHTFVYSTAYSGADQRTLQSSASLTFVRRIHRGLVNSSHKWPVTRKMFPFDDAIMVSLLRYVWYTYFSYKATTTIARSIRTAICVISLYSWSMGDLSHSDNFPHISNPWCFELF